MERVKVDRILEKISGAKLLKITCPFCSKTHTHGLPKNQTLPAQRVAHCLNSDPMEKRDYLIV